MFRHEGVVSSPARRALSALGCWAMLAMLAMLALLAWLPPAAAAPPGVTLLTVHGAIGPAQADYIARGIARAAEHGRQLVILRMDTPGGLDTSMRAIIKAILASRVPVASYVAPGGARAASAGTYILYASHVAAMAPGTNLGAATPVQIGMPGQEPKPGAPDEKADKPKPPEATDEDDATASPSTRKQVNDAAAYIRGLAQMRGRNADWAERAVREAVSLPAEEALQQQVIDLVAPDLDALLAQLDGRKVTLDGETRILQTRGATVDDVQPDWRTRVLAAITDPGIALLLMTIGIYGLIFEFMSPGTGIPGVIGAICLLLAMYALQLLPLNYAGVALILLGLAFMAAEAFLPSFGILGLGGIAAFIAGALILIDTDVPGFGIPLALIVGIALVSALLLAFTVGIAIKTRRRPVAASGGLIGSIGEVLEPAQDGAWVRVHGETWRARSASTLQRAQKVQVTGRNGLLLEVVPANHQDQGE